MLWPGDSHFSSKENSPLLARFEESEYARLSFTSRKTRAPRASPARLLFFPRARRAQMRRIIFTQADRDRIGSSSTGKRTKRRPRDRRDVTRPRLTRLYGTHLNEGFSVK